MGREQLGRATKQEATRKFEEPMKAKINYKELKAAKAKLLADTLLKQWNIPRNIAGMLRKRPRKLKRLHSRKPFKTRKILLQKVSVENDEDAQEFMFAPHFNVNFSRSRFIRNHEDSPLLFLQRNLAYQAAFDKGLVMRKKSIRNYNESGRPVQEMDTKTLWLHLSRFRIGKRKFFKYPFDINVEVFSVRGSVSMSEKKQVNGNLSSVHCKKIASFLLPYLDQSPCVKFSERRFYPKQFCEFPIEVSANTLKPNVNLHSSLVLKIEVVPTNCGPYLRPNVVSGLAYIDIVKNGVLVLPRKNAYDLGMNFVDWSLRKGGYPTVGFVGAIYEAPNLGFTDRCLSKRSVKRMGQFYVNPDAAHGQAKKEIDLSQLLTIEDEDNDDDLEKYIEEKFSEMTLEKETAEMKQSNVSKEIGDFSSLDVRKPVCVPHGRIKKRTLTDIIPVLEKRAIQNLSKKSSNVKRASDTTSLTSIFGFGNANEKQEMENVREKCLHAEPRALNKFNFCPICGKFVTINVADEEIDETDGPQEGNIFGMITENKDPSNQASGDDGNENDLGSKQCEEMEIVDSTNTNADTSGQEDQRNKRELSKIMTSKVKLTGNFAYEEALVLPIEMNLVLSNGSVLKRNLNCLQCVFCFRRFDSYEIMLLHLNYSHIGYNVIHFPSNYGSIIEIRVNDDMSAQSKKKLLFQSGVEEPGQARKKSRNSNARTKPKAEENNGSEDKTSDLGMEISNSGNEIKEKEASVKSLQKTGTNDKKLQHGSNKTEILYESPLNGFMFKAHKNVAIHVCGESSDNSTKSDKRRVIVEVPEKHDQSRFSEKQLGIARKNIIGFIALNQVGIFALRKSKKRFRKVCKTSLTPGGFYHSRGMTERTAVTQGYCSDNDEDTYPWYDESQQRWMTQMI